VGWDQGQIEIIYSILGEECILQSMDKQLPPKIMRIYLNRHICVSIDISREAKTV